MIPSCAYYFKCFAGNYLRLTAQVCDGCSAYLLPSELRMTMQHRLFTGTTQRVASAPVSEMCLGDCVFLRNGYKMQKLGPVFKHLQVVSVLTFGQRR